MATFALVHGAGDSGWAWHLVVEELRRRGHHAVAPDLAADDDSAELGDYADTVLRALDVSPGQDGDLVVVGHSYGAFTAPLVAARVPTSVLVLVAGLVPAPGETPQGWWDATGYVDAVAEQAARDGGLTGNDDPYVCYFHDVPRDLADESMRRERAHPSEASGRRPWPEWPQVPTRYVVCTQDRFLPAGLARRLARERLGVEPDEIAAGHCVALSRPKELADLLIGHLP